MHILFRCCSKHVSLQPPLVSYSPKAAHLPIRLCCYCWRLYPVPQESPSLQSTRPEIGCLCPAPPLEAQGLCGRGSGRILRVETASSRSWDGALRNPQVQTRQKSQHGEVGVSTGSHLYLTKKLFAIDKRQEREKPKQAVSSRSRRRRPDTHS